MEEPQFVEDDAAAVGLGGVPGQISWDSADFVGVGARAGSSLASESIRVGIGRQVSMRASWASISADKRPGSPCMRSLERCRRGTAVEG